MHTVAKTQQYSVTVLLFAQHLDVLTFFVLVLCTLTNKRVTCVVLHELSPSG